MTQLELQKAKELLEKFEELQQEFNNKYEDLEIEIDNDFELHISLNYFNYEYLNKLQQAIIDYKKIIKG